MNLSRLRNTFITGLLVLVPFYLSIWVLWRFVLGMDGVLKLIPSEIPLGQTLRDIPGLGVLLTGLCVLFVGVIARTYVGRQVERAGDDFFQRIPLVSTIYSGTKQLLSRVLTSTRSFGKVVMIEYPRRDLWCIAFLAAEGFASAQKAMGRDDLQAVFLPTTPNPTSGFLMYVPKDDIIELDISIEEAFRLIVSFGVARPEGDNHGS